MRRIACVSILVLAALGLGAQESGSSPDIGTVDVTAQAFSPLILAPAGSVTVLSAADIARSGASTAAQALEAVPGVTVNSYGASGAQATISVGAAPSNQVLVIVDGIRLNDPLNGAPDLNQIPAASIAKIEVLQGGASAAYGADAVGGVIVITTKKSGKQRLNLGVTNTAYPTALGLGGASSLVDGQKFTMDSGTKIGLADLAVSAQAERGSNAYDYSNAGTSSLRSNAQFWNAGGSASLGLPAAGGRFQGSFAGNYQYNGAPGPLYSLSSVESQTYTNLHGSLGWSSDALAGGLLSLDVLGHGNYSGETDSLYSPYQVSGTGLDIRAVDAVANFCSLGFGGSASYEAANESIFDSRPDGQPTRFSLGSYVEPTFLVGDRLKITPSLRYDWNTNYTAGLSEMLGAVYQANDILDLRLSGGRSFRSPTFADLYWPLTYYPDYGYYYQGNPNLKPETSYSGELGADLKAGKLSCSASLKARYVEDMITYYTDPVTYNGTEINLDSVFISGASLSASYAIGPATLAAGYEFAYPVDLSGGSTIWNGPVLTDSSQHTVTASADFAFGRATAGLTGRFASSHTDSASTSQTLPNLFLLGLRSSFQVAQNTKLTFDVDNLLDQQYQVIYGYPMPGITLKLGMLVSL
ncbi:MAG: TonB-dependent receptor [Treponema sp.]|nr:TonB-dependent receptor [Treponema sp.]